VIKLYFPTGADVNAAVAEVTSICQDPDEVVPQVADLLLGECRASQAELDHRHVGRVCSE